MTGTWVLHVDLDQFVAAVEIRRRPELAGVPLVIGGDGDPTRPRQVVATASYEARAFGVGSGTPLRTALRRCPDAVFLPVDHAACNAASAEVMAVLRTFPVVVEVLGWDEAFLGADTDDPLGLAAEVRAAVRRETRLSCALGIGASRQHAKVAVRAAKPGGIHRISPEEWMPLMANRPPDDLWGVGPRTARTLAGHGLTTIGAVAAADDAALATVFGPVNGPRLRRTALGVDDGPITDAERVPTSRSRSVTYPRDLEGPEVVAEALVVLADELAAAVIGDGHAVARVFVTVRTATFFTRTRSRTLPAPTRDADVIREAAREVLARFPLDRPVRLLAVRLEFA
jgi:DNA polymerase-4